MQQRRGVNRCTQRNTVTWSTVMPRSASSSSTSRSESVAQIPSHRHHDHLRWEAETGETRPRRGHSGKTTTHQPSLPARGDPPMQQCRGNQFVARDQHISVEERTWVAQRREKIPQDAGIKLTRWTRCVVTYRRTCDTSRSSAGPVRRMAPDRVVHRTAAPTRRVVVQTVLGPRHSPRPALPPSGGSAGCRPD